MGFEVRQNWFSYHSIIHSFGECSTVLLVVVDILESATVHSLFSKNPFVLSPRWALATKLIPWDTIADPITTINAAKLDNYVFFPGNWYAVWIVISGLEQAETLKL